MLKPKVPGLGFGALALAFVLTAVAFAMHFATYAAGSYATSRWTIMCSVLAMWLLLLLLVNGLFVGEKPAWTGFIYALTAFLLTYGAAKFMQPCLTQIGIYFTVNMGDTAMNEAVTKLSIPTAILYVAAVLLTIVAAFLPVTWRSGRRKDKIADEHAESEGVSGEESK